MLQRAASNACSWWWASHIRTKQSKWLEQSLQDMEEKVHGMLKLIEEDGDSFAKRAEMYYKRRPELISSVEEAYRCFRSLADRYDMLSKELQNANHTIATVFPEQVQFPIMEDDDEEEEDDENGVNGKLQKNNPQIPSNHKVPKAPADDLKGLITKATKKFIPKKPTANKHPHTTTTAKAKNAAAKSGLTKEEAFDEIDKLQKEILALQTVKEFVKSSYESGLAKYWAIENQIAEVQEKVCKLQDEFDVEATIEDSEARTLMAEAALKSCQETLTRLQEKQARSAREAREEHKKVEEAKKLIKSMKDEFLNKDEQQKIDDGDEEARSEASSDVVQAGSVAGSASGTLTVSELAEKIDELVNKVIGLESAVSSQAIMIETLRSESDDLHAHIRVLEEERGSLIDGQNGLRRKLEEMEERLKKLQAMNKNVESRNSSLQTNFAEACSSLGDLSEKLSSVRPDEEEEDMGGADVVTKSNKKTVTFSGLKPEDGEGEGGKSKEEEEGLNWQELLLSGAEDREKILLTEYSTILKNYKDVKKKLSDTEKKERDGQFDVMVQLRELKKAISKRDQEIQSLRQMLNSLQGIGENDDNHDKSTSRSDDFDMNLDSQSLSPIEEKLRLEIDSILNENLDFWLRFSTAFHQVQKFKSEVQDLQDEIVTLKDKKKQEGSITSVVQLKSEARPIYKHLREIDAQLSVWVEHSGLLKGELKRRYASLCSIQEEITKALKKGVEGDEIRFSSHQAAKLQGEVLNMKNENDKVREELHAGLEHVAALQAEIERTLGKMNQEFGIASAAGDQPKYQKAMSRPKVPLRSFIFGTRPRKQKHSIFSFIHSNKKYRVVRAAPPLSSEH